MMTPTARGVLPGPVVDGAWLRAHLDEVVVADVRWYLDGRSGRAAYEAGHIPGAVFLDLDTDLSAPPSPAGGRHPLPDPEAFAAALGAAGIGDGCPVVAYDDASGMVAGRLWWMLRSLGEPAAVLDGGLAAWPGPLATAAPPPSAPPPSAPPPSAPPPSAPPPFAPPPTEPSAAPEPAQPAVASPPAAARFTARPWPESAYATIDEVDKLRLDPDAVLLDARSAERYRGEPNAIDPRFGHIPGAVSVPHSANVTDDGKMRSPDELRQLYAAAGVTGDVEVVASCGSGVSACLDLLALELAGLTTNARLFVDSWSAWGADPTRPLATGPTPT